MANRRAHGDGGLYQRKSDGLWVGSIHLGWVNGIRKRKDVYGKTQAEAREKLTRLTNDRDRGITIPTKRQTVGEYLTWWLAESVKPTVRPSTFVSYCGLVRLHIVPALGRVQLAKLSAQHVQTLLNAKSTAGLSPRTVQYIRAVLRRALNVAVKFDLVARNVATLTDPPASRRHEITPLDAEGARKFLDQIQNDRLRALYRVALALGLRKGEALGLRWNDIDFDNGRLMVRNSLQYAAGKPVLVPPKTNKSRRTITMPAQLVAELRQHRTRQLEERLIAGGRWQDNDLVFTTPIGTPVDQSRLSRELHKHLEAAGLPRIRFHDLRHTAASLLVAEGVHPRVVMEILGHSQIAITMNIYSHVVSDAMRDATDRLGAVLMGTEETDKPSNQTPRLQ